MLVLFSWTVKLRAAEETGFSGKRPVQVIPTIHGIISHSVRNRYQKQARIQNNQQASTVITCNQANLDCLRC
jgi:hypothetical protein